MGDAESELPAARGLTPAGTCWISLRFDVEVGLVEAVGAVW